VVRRPDEQRAAGISTHRDLDIGGEHNQVAGRDIVNVRLEQAERRPVALLPADALHFTGRQDEIGHLESEVLAAQGQAIVISAVAGKPGVGKSALAVHLAHRLSKRFPDGQLYVNLRGADQKPVLPATALSELLHILGISEAQQPISLEGKSALYRHAVAGQRLLIVIDNAHDDAQVRPLLPGSTSGAVLVTSRQILATLSARTLILDVLDSDHALELLRKIVGAGRIDADRQAALAMVAVCGGLPLALQIVGAKLAARPDWSIAQVVERLADERHRLSELGMGDLSVRATFQLSYEALPEQHARAFRLLALWPGADFHPWITAAVISVDMRTARRILDDLVILQLIEPTVISDRYRMHDLLRLFANEQLVEESSDDREAAWVLLANAALEHAREMTTTLQISRLESSDHRETEADPATALRWLENEHSSLVAIVEQTVTRGPVGISWELSKVLYQFLDYRAHRPELCEMAEAAYRAAKAAGVHGAQFSAWNDLFHAYLGDDRVSEAEHILDDRLLWVQDNGNLYHRVRYVTDLLEIFKLQNRLDDVEYMLSECLAAFRKLGSEHYEAIFLRQLGALYMRLDRLDDAEQALTSSLAISRKHDHTGHVAEELKELARVYYEQERFNDAEEALVELLTLVRPFKDRHDEAKTLGELAHSHDRCSHEHDGEPALMEALGIFRELGDRRCEVNTLSCLGHVYDSRGDKERAADVLSAGIAICRQINDFSRETELREQLDSLQVDVAPPV
jgi:tetratricopeptide (TPR) repeat protein